MLYTRNSKTIKLKTMEKPKLKWWQIIIKILREIFTNTKTQNK